VRGIDKYQMGSTKTASGTRQVTLPTIVVESFRAHYIRQIEARLNLGQDYQDQGLLFANEIGQSVAPSTLARHFERIVKSAGLPHMRIHDLRHGHATMLMEDGVHPKVVGERLGHSNTRITLDLYSHVTPRMQRQVSDRLERLIEGTG
jgi:integrase